jgi:viroplasmin and RNaseH domain-containing protein
MNSITINELSKYLYGINQLTLRKNKKTGILNLSKFNNLEKINCSDNNFTSLEGLSLTIVEIDCSQNEFNKLDNLRIIKVYKNV